MLIQRIHFWVLPGETLVESMLAYSELLLQVWTLQASCRSSGSQCSGPHGVPSHSYLSSCLPSKGRSRRPWGLGLRLHEKSVVPVDVLCELVREGNCSLFFRVH